MNPHTASLAVATGLRGAAWVLLALVLAGQPWPAPRDAIEVVVLTDRSASVATGHLERARQEVLAALRDARTRVATFEIEFAGQPGNRRPMSFANRSNAADSREALEPRASDLQAALLAALAAGTRPPDVVLVLSDGHATQGDARRGLEAAAASGVPVLWRTVPPDVATPRIIEAWLPAKARPQQRVPVTVQLGGAARAPVAVTISARDRAVAPVSASLEAGPLGKVSLEVQTDVPGTMLLDIELNDAASGSRLDWHPAAAVLEVRAPSDVLFVSHESSPFAESLRAGGWSVVREPPERLDALADGLAAFAAVVLDDVPYHGARHATWQALARAVRDDGTGLLVLGGAQSFAAGDYRDSSLEAILPVVSRPGSTGEGASFVFLVDKSGSMGASAAGVDRFRMAQRAVIDTAATLASRDAAGLIVFDVAAREILPLEPAGQFQQAVAQPWPAQPRGGTRLLPALELALSRLEAAPAGRRFLVLVTDGFVIDGDDVALRERIERAGIELVALGVGADADLARLRRLVPPERGTVLHVAEAAELPTLMRSSLEHRRAPVERGPIGVASREPLPFLDTAATGWPRVAAYAVTGARPEATVHLESARGDPLLASWSVGLGRVAALAAGLGAWTPEWLRWPRWPAFAGGLTQWVSRDATQPGWAVHVTDRPAELQVDVDTADDGRWSTATAAGLRVRTPTGREIATPLAPSAPGRLSVSLPEAGAGLYTLTVESAHRSQRLMHLRQDATELGPLEPSRHIGQWREAGLLRTWSAHELRSTLDSVRTTSQRPVAALLLVLALFLLGVAAERYAPAILRAWVRSNRPKPRSS